MSCLIEGGDGVLSLFKHLAMAFATALPTHNASFPSVPMLRVVLPGVLCIVFILISSPFTQVCNAKSDHKQPRAPTSDFDGHQTEKGSSFLLEMFSPLRLSSLPSPSYLAAVNSTVRASGSHNASQFTIVAPPGFRQCATAAAVQGARSMAGYPLVPVHVASPSEQLPSTHFDIVIRESPRLANTAEVTAATGTGVHSIVGDSRTSNSHLVAEDTATSVPPSAGIVVLGNRPLDACTPSVTSVRNAMAGAALYHSLQAQGVHSHVVLTGGATAGGDVSEAWVMGCCIALLGVPSTALALETEARNTAQNALFSAKELSNRLPEDSDIYIVAKARQLQWAEPLFRQHFMEASPAANLHFVPSNVTTEEVTAELHAFLQLNPNSSDARWRLQLLKDGNFGIDW